MLYAVHPADRVAGGRMAGWRSDRGGSGDGHRGSRVRANRQRWLGRDDRGRDSSRPIRSPRRSPGPHGSSTSWPRATANRSVQASSRAGSACRSPRSRTSAAPWRTRVWSDGISTGFALGRRLAELGGAYLASVDQVQEFYEASRSLPAGSEETVQFAVLDGLEVTYLARHDGRQPVQLSSGIGRRLPAFSTATGKAALASLAETTWPPAGRCHDPSAA